MTNEEVELGFLKGGRNRKTAIELTIKKYEDLPKHWKVLKGFFYTRDSHMSAHYPCGVNCPLCIFYSPNCDNCPLTDCMVQDCIFHDVWTSIEEEDEEKFLKACKQMVTFLKSVLKKEGKKAGKKAGKK